MRQLARHSLLVMLVAAWSRRARRPRAGSGLPRRGSTPGRVPARGHRDPQGALRVLRIARDGDIYRANLRTGKGRVISQGPGAARRSDEARPPGPAVRGRRHGGDGRVVGTDTGEILRSWTFTTSENTFVNDVVLTRRAAYFTDSSRRCSTACRSASGWRASPRSPRSGSRGVAADAGSTPTASRRPPTTGRCWWCSPRPATCTGSAGHRRATRSTSARPADRRRRPAGRGAHALRRPEPAEPSRCGAAERAGPDGSLKRRITSPTSTYLPRWPGPRLALRPERPFKISPKPTPTYSATGVPRPTSSCRGEASTFTAKSGDARCRSGSARHGGQCVLLRQVSPGCRQVHSPGRRAGNSGLGVRPGPGASRLRPT